MKLAKIKQTNRVKIIGDEPRVMVIRQPIPEKKTLTCLRCGYEWQPRLTKSKPRQCPFCKSMKWDVKRTER